MKEDSPGLSYFKADHQ